jgi:acyl-CoA synthetase (AMP-forming)/AMP-acid ligase II
MRPEPKTLSSLADKHAIEGRPLDEQWRARTVYEMLCETAGAHPRQPAISFQLRGNPGDRAFTQDWAGFRAEVTQIANLYRDLGLKRGEVVAFLMPNLPEMASAMVAAMTAGVAAPINPLLEPEQISAILRETGATMLVTIAPFVKTDIAEKAAEAVRYAPECRIVLEADIARYLTPPLKWIAPLMAPRRGSYGTARVLSLAREKARMRADALDFADDDGPDDVCGYFHTGGTTGAPKIAMHRHRGALYNGWLVSRLLLTPADTVLCPLPLFHVLAAYPMLMACIASGCHFVMPTPAGYRGPGVMENFWKLVERWKANFVCTVPTAVSALMQRRVDADITSLRYALCGSAPMPPELFRRFEAAAAVKILEGYGQTETTCLISCNPAEGERKIGSVGLPFPYTDVRILKRQGEHWLECGVDEIGEICVRSPGCIPGYLDEERNDGLFAAAGLVRTGDLGRLDGDGYLWITGRAARSLTVSAANVFSVAASTVAPSPSST